METNNIYFELFYTYCVLTIEKEENECEVIDIDIDFKVESKPPEFDDLRIKLCEALKIGKNEYIYDLSKMGIRVRSKVKYEDYDFYWNDVIIYEKK